MAKFGAVEVGFNEETLEAIRTLQRTVDRFTPEAGGGFAEVPGDAWSDEHFVPSHIRVSDVREDYISLSAHMSDSRDSVAIIIQDASTMDNLIGLLIHWRRRAFGHE